MLISALCTIQAQETANSRQARRIFNSAYQQVFGEKGATLHYDVNITGLYKTHGTIWYKGKKSKFEDAKMSSWNDGQIVYTVKKKKREVEIHTAKNNKSDKYSQKFKFEPENYTYSIKDAPEGYYITLKAKKGVKGIKEARCLLDKKNRYPVSVRVKVGIFHTTIKISEFKVGGITDQLFEFPREQYSSCKFIYKN